MFPCEDSKTVSVCPSVCLSVCPHPEKRYHHSFVNISPTLVIDTSMERSLRVLYHGNPKIWFFFCFQKSSKFDFWVLTKSWNHLSFVNISPTLVIDTSMERSSRVLHLGSPEMWNFFKKFKIDEIEFCPYPEFPYAEKKIALASSIQFYISNWYVNGKVFTSTTSTTWEPKNLFFFIKKVRNWIRLVFWLVLMSWNHSSRSQHAPIWRHRGCIVVSLRVDI